MPKLDVTADLFKSMTLAARLPTLLPHLLKPVVRLPTGWPLLDAALAEPGTPSGGFVVPSTVVIGAPPKAGKSIWAQCVTQSLVQRGHAGLYWDLENGAARFIRRLGWRLAKIASRELSKGLDAEQEKRRDRMIKWMKEQGKSFAYASDKSPSIDDVATWCASADKFADGDPWIFVVDSLQKLPPLPKLDRRGSIDTWLRFFEGLKDECNCVTLIVSELNRASYDKTTKSGAPTYKESGDIEYTCDLGLAFSPVKMGKDKIDPLSAWLDILWDRDGARDEPRVGKYTRVLPYYEIVEEEPRKKLTKNLDTE